MVIRYETIYIYIYIYIYTHIKIQPIGEQQFSIAMDPSIHSHKVFRPFFNIYIYI